MVRFVLPLLLIAGCAGGMWVPDGYYFSIPAQGFQDIPIPPFDFAMVPGKTFTYVCPVDPQIRVARVVLTGGSRLDDTVKFFERELPAQGFFPIRKPHRSKVMERVRLFYKKRGRDEFLFIDISREEKSVNVGMKLVTYPPE